MKKFKCPLCGEKDTLFFSRDKKRDYRICSTCNTIHVPKEFHLSEEDEKKRYNLHINCETDKRYISFLEKIVLPITSNLKSKASGLDFGCGPGPVLKKIFKQKDIIIEEYDLYYKNNIALLNINWDFIVTTEVVEHLKTPFIVLEKLWLIINNGGLLALMTSLYSPEINFPSWYYKGDPTHIIFYTKESFIWLADKLNCNIEFFDKNIIILKKN